jgi:hypothetical protein
VETKESSEPVDAFVCGIRLHHILTALGCLHTGRDQSWSFFDGGIDSGFYFAVDAASFQLVIAWGATGVVAIVYVGEDDNDSNNLEVMKEESELNPERFFGNLPADMQGLLLRLRSHPKVRVMATGGFWLARAQPNLQPLESERLRPLRGFRYPPDIAIHGNGPRWEGWKETIYMTQRSISLSVALERRSRHTTCEISREEGEALIPAEWFDPSLEPPQHPGARLIRDGLTATNFAMAREMLAQVGVQWDDAVSLLASRRAAVGAAPSDD